MIDNKKILVIGGAGFVGSHLCEKLGSSNEVVSLDNYISGSKANHIDSVSYYEGSSIDIEKILSDFVPNYIFHLGEYSRVESSFDDYSLVIENNVFPISNVLEYASKRDAKLVYAGSSTKFGDKFGGKDLSPYAWTKAVNTEHIINYSKWFGINFAITYFYNVYGGREIQLGKYATLIGIYKDIYSQGKTKYPVVKPGDQVRNFTHYSDIISGLIYVAKYGEGDGYGIGAEKSYSILDVVGMFNGKPDFLPKRKGNRLSAELITEKTKALGWIPSIDLRSHIAEFIANTDRSK